MKIYFKHSTQCPVSSRAKMEMDHFLKSKPQEIEYEFIDVLADRTRSHEIAGQFNVEHESPQVIITGDNGQVLWTASHRKVTEENVLAAIRENS
jgi:bacillithiol system protein YtxJ